MVTAELSRGELRCKASGTRAGQSEEGFRLKRQHALIDIYIYTLCMQEYRDVCRGGEGVRMAHYEKRYGAVQ